MRTKNPQATPFNLNLTHHCPARLKRRQVKRARLGEFELTAYQQGIAVPSCATRLLGYRHEFPWRIIDGSTGKDAGALAEPPINLLQGDYVSIDLAQYGDDTVRITPAIKAHRLVNIIAGKPYLHARCRENQSDVAPAM